MKRLHGISLVIGIMTGIAISVGVSTFMAPKPVVPVQAPTVPQAIGSAPAAAVPATHSKPQRRKRASSRQVAVKSTQPGPVQNVGNKPIWQLPGTVDMPLEGGIFSGVDPKDPRIYHFAETTAIASIK
jgi:hypothetical protein